MTDSYHGDKSTNEPALVIDNLSGQAEKILDRVAEEHIASRNQQIEQIRALVKEHGFVSVIDALGAYCEEMEEDSKLDDQEPSARKWWAARVHIEHCSNIVEMLEL